MSGFRLLKRTLREAEWGARAEQREAGVAARPLAEFVTPVRGGAIRAREWDVLPREFVMTPRVRAVVARDFVMPTRVLAVPARDFVMPARVGPVSTRLFVMPTRVRFGPTRDFVMPPRVLTLSPRVFRPMSGVC